MTKGLPLVLLKILMDYTILSIENYYQCKREGIFVMQLLDLEAVHELYSLKGITYIEQDASLPPADTQQLLVVAAGQGQFSVDGCEVPASKGKCFMLAPGSRAAFQSTGEEKLGIYLLSYHAFRINGHQASLMKTGPFGDRFHLLVRPFSRLLGLIRDIVRQRPNTGKSSSQHCQALFHELMALLTDQSAVGASPEDVVDAVKRTIAFMQEHYREKLTVGEMVRLSGVALWQYSPVFQSLTGKKPLDYLTDIRLSRAKEMLLQTEENVEEIARTVGFVDPYYFIRRFRQKTGLTPRQYALQWRQEYAERVFRDSMGQVVALPETNSRIVYYDGKTFGDLFALDLNAVGGSHWLIAGSTFHEQIKDMEDVGFPLDPGKVRSLHPDLIVISNYCDIPLDELRDIAPTVVLDQNQGLEKRLRTLGELFKKQQEAELWLLRYEAQAEYAWTLCSSLIEPGESATVYTLAYGGKMYVMAAQGLPNTLYHPKGFRPPDSVRSLIDAGEPFACIPEEQLSTYAGDRVFIVLPSPLKDPVSYEAGLSMMQSPLWRRLPAVRNGRCRTVEAPWNSEDATTRFRLLRELPDMLAQSHE